MMLIISSLSPSDTLIHLTTDFVIMGTPMRGRLACVGAVLLVATATGVAPGLTARAMAPAPVVRAPSLHMMASKRMDQARQAQVEADAQAISDSVGALLGAFGVAPVDPRAAAAASRERIAAARAEEARRVRQERERERAARAAAAAERAASRPASKARPKPRPKARPTTAPRNPRKSSDSGGGGGFFALLLLAGGGLFATGSEISLPSITTPSSVTLPIATSPIVIPPITTPKLEVFPGLKNPVRLSPSKGPQPLHAT